MSVARSRQASKVAGREERAAGRGGRPRGKQSGNSRGPWKAKARKWAGRASCRMPRGKQARFRRHPLASSITTLGEDRRALSERGTRGHVPKPFAGWRALPRKRRLSAVDSSSSQVRAPSRAASSKRVPPAHSGPSQADLARISPPNPLEAHHIRANANTVNAHCGRGTSSLEQNSSYCPTLAPATTLPTAASRSLPQKPGSAPPAAASALRTRRAKRSCAGWAATGSEGGRRWVGRCRLRRRRPVLGVAELGGLVRSCRLQLSSASLERVSTEKGPIRRTRAIDLAMTRRCTSVDGWLLSIQTYWLS